MSPSSPYALILDDPPLVAHGMAEFLRARMPQMDVVVASGADDLLRWVGTRGTPAIVLVDFWLAEGSALGLIAQVRAHCPGTPIAVISGDDDPAVMAQARQYPGQERAFFEFVQKNPQMQQQLRAPIFEDKVVDLILSQAQVSDEKVSKEDLMKEDDMPAGYGA